MHFYVEVEFEHGIAGIEGDCTIEKVDTSFSHNYGIEERYEYYIEHLSLEEIDYITDKLDDDQIDLIKEAIIEKYC